MLRCKDSRGSRRQSWYWRVQAGWWIASSPTSTDVSAPLHAQGYAVLASNFLPPLLDLAARLMERAGVTSEEALPALLPLVRGTRALRYPGQS